MTPNKAQYKNKYLGSSQFKKKNVTLMSSKPEPATWSHDTG